MKQFISFVQKEARHILRDRRTMLILFGMPVVLMLLFGFAITTDVRNVRTVVVTSQLSPQNQQAIERLAASEYFTIVATVPTPKDAELLIRHQKADLAIVFAPKRAGVQFIVDGADPNMAQQWTNYAQSIISQPSEGTYNSLPSPFGEVGGEAPLQSADAFGIQLRASHHGYAADAHLRHDDLYFHCPREGARHYGGAARLSRASVDGGIGEGGTLSGAGNSHPHYHTSHGPFRARRATRWLVVLDCGGEHTLYPACPFVRTAHLKHRQDTTCGVTALCYGAAYARSDALRHAVPRGVDASDTSMGVGNSAASLLYFGYA